MGKDYFKRQKDKEAGEKTSSGMQFSVMPAALSSFPTNSIPTTQEMGARLKDDGLVSDLTNPFQKMNSTPGWMRITFLPVLGSNAHMRRASTLRMVPNNIWSSLRNFCTTATNYQPGDVLNVITQLAQVPMMLAKVRRQMKALKMTSDLKNYYPYEFWRALVPVGSTKAVEIAQLDNNISLYNSIVEQYNKIAPPDMFPVFHRWEYMLETVFTDIEPKEGEVAQWIFFDTDTYYRTHLADPTIPGAEMEPHSMMVDIRGLLNMINDIVNDMFEDASTRLILGDLYQTYGDKNLYTVDHLTWDEVSKAIEPKYDFETLFALYHATVVPVTPPTLNVDVMTGELVGHYIVGLPGDEAIPRSLAKAWIQLPKLYNAHEWGTTVESFVKHTCWMLYEPEYNDTDGIRAPGTEILTRMEVSLYEYPHNDEKSSVETYDIHQYRFYQKDGTWSGEHYAEDCFDVALVSSFAFAPIIYFGDFALNGTEVYEMKCYGWTAELELPVFTDYNNLVTWKDAARIGLWGLPKDIQYKIRNTSGKV